MNILDFYQKKKTGEKICMVTCYDYTSARLLATTSIDALLVGDSLAMVIHGYKDTVSATMTMMQLHTKAVHRGADNKFIMADLPFLSYRKSIAKSMSCAQKLMQAGANALKLEGEKGNLALIRLLTESGVPIAGHLGLTPQAVHTLGGWRVQGKTQESAAQIKESALRLQEAGCFCLILECIPASLAQEISQMLIIPTIGIGAGADTDGQILVFQDLLGLQKEIQLKFVKKFAQGYECLHQGIENYVSAIKSGNYPQDEHCYRA